MIAMSKKPSHICKLTSPLLVHHTSEFRISTFSFVPVGQEVFSPC